jgi:hypothetical protein
MAGRQGKPDEELFLSRPNNGGDSPTVEPLRIHKPNSPQPTGRGKLPLPATKMSFPLPPGASSSASPLPYPDDEDDDDEEDHFPPPAKSQTYRTPYPEDRRPSEQGGFGGPTQEQSRPAAGGRRPSNDTAPRLMTSPIDKRGPGLAERRGTAPKPLPESPGPDLPDKDDGLFAKPLRRDTAPAPVPAPSTVGGRRPLETGPNPYPDYHQQYFPPSAPKNNAVPVREHLTAPTPNAMNRFSSTASTSTTRATRGSPPPPETPILGPGDPGAGVGIEARYAAAGISGTATLNSLQAQNAAAAQRQNQYGPPPVPQLPRTPGLPVQQQHAPRPWSPQESPESDAPPLVFHGSNEVTAHPAASPPPATIQQNGPQSTVIPQAPNSFEQDFQRMNVSPQDPPPAYSSVTPNGGAGSSSYPAEKGGRAAAPAAISTAQKQNIAPPLMSPELQHPNHPAFANDPPQPMLQPQHATQPLATQQQQQQPQQQPQIQKQLHPQAVANSSPFQGAGPSSPPPLPEGWIAHLDQNSGQYYYIHLPTQATQWEFPKGPTPLNHDIAPLSPVMSTYGNHPLMSPGLSAFGKQPLGSPGFPPHTPGYAESIMSMTSQTPTTAGFSGPPPSAGVDMYKVAPTNGVYFGPYLRYVNMDMERGLWLGTIMLVTDGPQPPTIHIHQSVDLSPDPRQLKANPIFTHQRWTFYRYDVDLQMGEGPGDKWTYAITSHLGCTRYEFLVAGRYDTNWRFIAHSGNDFAMNTSAAERSKLGGIGFMWKDILQKNVECGGFHVQLGLGDQIYGDRLWKEIPLLKQWLAMSGKDNRKSAPWTARHEEDVSHSYFHYYTSHFDQPYLREAFAQIPHVLQIDDHDM